MCEALLQCFSGSAPVAVQDFGVIFKERFGAPWRVLSAHLGGDEVQLKTFLKAHPSCFVVMGDGTDAFVAPAPGALRRVQGRGGGGPPGEPPAERRGEGRGADRMAGAGAKRSADAPAGPTPKRARGGGDERSGGGEPLPTYEDCLANELEQARTLLCQALRAYAGRGCERIRVSSLMATETQAATIFTYPRGRVVEGLVPAGFVLSPPARLFGSPEKEPIELFGTLLYTDIVFFFGLSLRQGVHKRQESGLFLWGWPAPCHKAWGFGVAPQTPMRTHTPK